MIRARRPRVFAVAGDSRANDLVRFNLYSERMPSMRWVLDEEAVEEHAAG